MYSCSRIAVAELFLFRETARVSPVNTCERAPVRGDTACFCSRRSIERNSPCRRIKFRSKRISCFQQERSSSFGAMDGQKQKPAELRCAVRPRSDLQLQRRQAE